MVERFNARKSSEAEHRGIRWGDAHSLRGRVLPWFVCLLLGNHPDVTSMARAGDLTEADQRDEVSNEGSWLSPGWLSLHANRAADRNGVNYGLGLEYGITTNWTLAAGVYDNSYGAITYYGGGIQRIWMHERWRLGLMLGVANGYRNVNDGGLFPYVFPMVQYQAGWFGANLALIPPVSRVTHGVVAVQFKVRF